ncbi:MAG: hypothetical protein OEX05_02725 [Chloroflexota bacterium]|jgi:hypothetical protein|nr:hypothetical protein [Chloroflexota bacterium]
MRSIVRSLSAIAGVAIIAVACSSAGGAAPATTAPTAAPTAAPPAAATPVPTPVEITAPPATAKPMTDGQGPEIVSGLITAATLTRSYARTNIDVAGEVTETIRDGEVAFTFDMNDARVNGKATWAFSVDLYTTVGPEWGPMHMETGDGAWDGQCTGGVWHDGDGLAQSCWLLGSGDYAGWTYYLTFTGPMNGDENGNGVVQGIVYPGAPPAP